MTTRLQSAMMAARPDPPPDELRTFLLVVRQALLVIVRYIEHRYKLERK